MARLMFLLLPLFFLATSCDDDDLSISSNETPLEELDRRVPITQEGAGTFGCLINGEVWTNVPGGGGANEDLMAQYYYPLESFTIFARYHYWDTSNNRENELFTIRLLPIQRYSIGIQSHLIEIDKPRFRRPLPNNSDYRSPYFIDTAQVNNTVITSFKENSISATFEMTLISEDKSDTLIVTDGRFDVPYTSYY